MALHSSIEALHASFLHSNGSHLGGQLSISLTFILEGITMALPWHDITCKASICELQVLESQFKRNHLKL